MLNIKLFLYCLMTYHILEECWSSIITRILLLSLTSELHYSLFFIIGYFLMAVFINTLILRRPAECTPFLLYKYSKIFYLKIILKIDRLLNVNFVFNDLILFITKTLLAFSFKIIMSKYLLLYQPKMLKRYYVILSSK